LIALPQRAQRRRRQLQRRRAVQAPVLLALAARRAHGVKNECVHGLFLWSCGFFVKLMTSIYASASSLRGATATWQSMMANLLAWIASLLSLRGAAATRQSQ
jgi:hypothetical protein